MASVGCFDVSYTISPGFKERGVAKYRRRGTDVVEAYVIPPTITKELFDFCPGAVCQLDSGGRLSVLVPHPFIGGSPYCLGRGDVILKQATGYSVLGSIAFHNEYEHAT